MYRIRSASGSEAVYNSLEEFHAAVRRGEVDAEDEIFHTRANRWLDVKSHPHYRSAVGWNGSGEPSLPPAPPVAAHPPAPAPRVAPAPQAAEARAQAAEPARPAAAAQQTVLRPQLVADRPPVTAAATPAAAPPAAPGPPRKSRELAFIDLGEPAPPKKQNVTIVEAQKPAPKPTPAPQHPQHGTEIQFLVMDGGIESPVRNSAGHRTVAEDLDLLFDAPLPAASNVAVAPPPAPPAPPKVETTVRPAASAPVAEPPRPEPPKPAPAPAPQPRASSPRLEVVKPPPKPAPTAEQVETVAPVAQPKAEPVAPTPEPARASAPRLEALKTSAPRLATLKPAAPAAPVPPPPAVAEVDLDIPDASLLTEPALAPVAPAAAGGARARTGMLYGAGAFVLVLGVAVAAWKPWARGTGDTPAPPPVTRPASSAPAESATTTPLVGAPAVSVPPRPLAGSAGRTPAGAVPTPDSAVEEPKDEIIAAARPNFRPEVDVGAASLSIGGDLPAAQPGAAAVAPSELARRLVRAESQLQEELTGRLGAFRDLLTPERLRTADGAARARTAWGAGADALRQYRSRLARLGQAYEDSALTSQRAQRWPAEELRAWSARQTAAEPAEVAQLTDLMVAQVSEGLDLLAASDGQYTVKGDRIAFTATGAVPRYLSIRTWVDQRMGTWRAQPENARPYTVTALLRALGEGFPAAQ
ncbi:MAG: hypothetical protein IPL76_11500 [Gemmatimonadetes bacterium]|nr:hypothetical protein [Gemmatimonadota bacterium]